MRILVIHNVARGGAWRRMREQVAGLDGEIHELTLSTGTAVTDSPRVVPFHPRAGRVPAALRPPLRYADAAMLSLAWRQLGRQALMLQPDVVFANACQFLQAPPVLTSTPVPTLYFCDEPRRVDHESDSAASRRRRTRALYAPIYRHERARDTAGARRATRLATNSHFSARTIEQAYGVQAAIVSPGVSEPFRHGTVRNDRDHVLLSVGMLTPGKGHDLAIRAASLSAEIRHVVIVSPRPSAAEARRLFTLANTVGIELEIRVGISDEELRAEYERAQVTAYLARSEPFGLAALEAQACGCPVIVSAEGGLPETILDGVTGLAVERDAEAAARAIDHFSDPEIARKAGSAAVRHARPWSWAASAARVQSLLEEVSSDHA